MKWFVIFLLLICCESLKCSIESKEYDTKINDEHLVEVRSLRNLLRPQVEIRTRATHLNYLRLLYRHFKGVFWNPGTTTRQFAAVTIEQITTFPHEPASDFPLTAPEDYNAAFYDQTQPRHTEPVLLDHLSTMILDYLQTYDRLPTDIYLYTYNIPCPRCTSDIVYYIENQFPNDLNNLISHNPRYQFARQQIPQMTYRIGWTLEMVPQEAIATIDAFHDVDDDTSHSRVAMYRRIRL